jgi:hypothetical protein
MFVSVVTDLFVGLMNYAGLRKLWIVTFTLQQKENICVVHNALDP